MKIVMFLAHLAGFKRANHLMFANSFLAAGWKVTLCRLNTVEAVYGRLHGETYRLQKPIREGDDYEHLAERTQLGAMDLAWLMDRPHHGIEKDVFQILWMFNQGTPFVNRIETTIFLNTKNTLPVVVPPENLIPTVSSCSYGTLAGIVAADSSSSWVVKPANEGNGADVYVLHPGESNSRAIMQSMTGNEGSKYETYKQATLGIVRKYALIQNYVAHASKAEKRVVLAGGKSIGCYSKVYRADDHRSTRVHGSTQIPSELTADEQLFCSALAKRLCGFGINYCGLDLAFPFVFEINLLTPGGLQTIDRLTGRDLTPDAIEAIVSSLKLA